MLASSDKASTDVSANIDLQKKKESFTLWGLFVCGARTMAWFNCGVSVLQE